MKNFTPVITIIRNDITGLFVKTTVLGRSRSSRYHETVAPLVRPYAGSVLDGQMMLYDPNFDVVLGRGNSPIKAYENACYFIGRSIERMVKGS